MGGNIEEFVLTFPEEDPREFDDLSKNFWGVEDIEDAFNIEFSCGDGKYMSDLKDSSELSRYDGKVSLQTPPRMRDTKEPLKSNRYYTFKLKYIEKDQEMVCYLNGKEISRRDV